MDLSRSRSGGNYEEPKGGYGYGYGVHLLNILAVLLLSLGFSSIWVFTREMGLSSKLIGAAKIVSVLFIISAHHKKLLVLVAVGVASLPIPIGEVCSALELE